MIKQVFISYSRNDSECMDMVRSFVKSIEPQTLVFIDSYSIVGGDKWQDKIIESIATCDIFVVVWTWNSSMSEWVKREIKIAKELQSKTEKPRIIPIILDETPLGFGLSTYQYVTLYAESSKCRFIEYFFVFILESIGFLCLTYFYKINNFKALGILIIFFLWILLNILSGLRKLNAPWNRTSKNKKVKFMLGSLYICKRLAIIILFLSLANLLYGMLLLWG